MSDDEETNRHMIGSLIRRLQEERAHVDVLSHALAMLIAKVASNEEDGDEYIASITSVLHQIGNSWNVEDAIDAAGKEASTLAAVDLDLKAKGYLEQLR